MTSIWRQSRPAEVRLSRRKASSSRRGGAHKCKFKAYPPTGHMAKTHEYSAQVTWNGNLGAGTSTYQGYDRDYTVAIEGKPELRGSADPMFRGSAELHNPEDLFVASISACHLLSYLALCARKGISVASYRDEARGTLELTPDGGGKFVDVALNPLVTISSGEESVAIALHDEAHKQCYIASSCSVPIRHNPIVKLASGPKPQE